jgi:hypothetical protein
MYLQLALSNAPDLSLWIIRFRVDGSSLSDWLVALLDEQQLVLLHGLDSLALDAVDELFVGRYIVDKTYDLTGGPYLMFVSIFMRYQRGRDIHQSPGRRSRRPDDLSSH